MRIARSAALDRLLQPWRSQWTAWGWTVKVVLKEGSPAARGPGQALKQTALPMERGATGGVACILPRDGVRGGVSLLERATHPLGGQPASS